MNKTTHLVFDGTIDDVQQVVKNLAISGVIAAAVVVVAYYALSFKLDYIATAANEAFNPGYDDSPASLEYADPVEYSSDEYSPPAFQGYARALNGLGSHVINR